MIQIKRLYKNILKDKLFRRDDKAISPIVATLVLIVVAIIGAAAVGLIMSSFSSNVSQQASSGDTADQASAKVLLVDSTIIHPVDMSIASQYSTNNSGVVITPVSGSQTTDQAAITAIGIKSADIAGTSRIPTTAEFSKFPNLQAYFAGGRAVIIIAHNDMTVLQSIGVSQSDLQNVYSSGTNKAIPVDMPSLKVAVRNNDGLGSENIFANWLTDGSASSLDGYTITPTNVALNNVNSEAAVLSVVSSTPGSIGFIDANYYYDHLTSVNNVIVIPVVNKISGVSQTPTEENIKNEIININDASYSSGLCRQLYYITNGQPSTLAQSFIRWAVSPSSSSSFDAAGSYSVTDLGMTGTAVNSETVTSDLYIYAAASLYNSFNDIKTSFQAQHPGVNVIFNFDSSTNLMNQIISGSPADIFASAATSQMTTLTNKGLVNSNQIFAKNQLAIIVPVSNPAHITTLSDFKNYNGHKIVVCGTTVPCGTYTNTMLSDITYDESNGYTSLYGPTFSSNFIANEASQETNVNNAIVKVALGEADAAIVYASDVPSAYKSDVILVPIEWWPSDDTNHAASKTINQLATYPIATIKTSTNANAQAFVDYVVSTDGQTILQNHGLLPPTYTIPA